MNEKKEHLSMVRYMFFMIIVLLLLCGLTYLLSSCVTEEVTPNRRRPEGPAVEVTFNLSINTPFGNDETLTPVVRSAGYEEPVTRVFRVASDVYLFATLRRENPVTTRQYQLAIDVKEGAKVRIIAYWGYPHYTNVYEYIDYTVVDGELIPDSGDGFSLPTDTYRFVSYTFYDDSALPPHNTPYTFDLADRI